VYGLYNVWAEVFDRSHDGQSFNFTRQSCDLVTTQLGTEKPSELEFVAMGHIQGGCDAMLLNSAVCDKQEFIIWSGKGNDFSGCKSRLCNLEACAEMICPLDPFAGLTSGSDSVQGGCV